PHPLHNAEPLDNAPEPIEFAEVVDATDTTIVAQGSGEGQEQVIPMAPASASVSVFQPEASVGQPPAGDQPDSSAGPLPHST
ncbi:hypothetical protein BG005_007380, partial [Podila minutissima]